MANRKGQIYLQTNDKELIEKIKIIAQYEDRSYTNQIINWMRQNVLKYEQTNPELFSTLNNQNNDTI